MLCQFLLYSQVNQLHMYPLFWGIFFHVSHYRALSRVPCAMQQFLVTYLYVAVCLYQFQSSNSSLLHLSSLVTTSLFSAYVTLFLFCKFICTTLLDFTCKLYMIFVFLCLTYFTQCDNLQDHPCCCRWHYFTHTKYFKCVFQCSTCKQIVQRENICFLRNKTFLLGEEMNTKEMNYFNDQ